MISNNIMRSCRPSVVAELFAVSIFHLAGGKPDAVCSNTHPFNGPFPGLPGRAGIRKVKPICILLDGARDSEWQWHQLGHMQVCTSLQTDNHASTPPLSFLQAGCPFCRPTNSVKALKAPSAEGTLWQYWWHNLVPYLCRLVFGAILWVKLW